MKILYRYRQDILQNCWFYNPPQQNNSYSENYGKNNIEKLLPHIRKWNEKRQTLCERSPRECSINIHVFLNFIHSLNPSWATEKKLDLKKIKGEFNTSCMAICSGCEKRIK